jgi:tetratricopeptide (TPR) repeat protein
MDTTYNFNKIIEFDSDFYRANMDDGQIQNRRIVIDLKPILLITNKQDNLPPLNIAFYLESLEKLNSLNPLHAKFTISTELSKLDVDSVRTLLNLTEQEKLRLSYDTYLYFYQGLLNSMIQNFNQSLKAYSTAIALNPEFDLAYFNRANTRYLMIEYVNSLEDYSQIITIDGTTTTHKEDKKQTLEYTDYNDVIEDLDKAIELNPTFAFAYYNRANVKCMTKDFTGAINDYTQSIEVKPEIPQAYFNRGLTLIYLRDNEKGCLDISKAGELGIEEAYPVIKKYCTNDN